MPVQYTRQIALSVVLRFAKVVYILVAFLGLLIKIQLTSFLPPPSQELLQNSLR